MSTHRLVSRSMVLAVGASALIGCGIAHERGTSDGGVVSIGDGSPSRPDVTFVRPDAWLPPIDAWEPPFVMATHGPSPIVPDQGGPRMAHPQLVIITYADDPDRMALEEQARWLVSSHWLTTVGAEYGVGAGSILGMVERTDAAPDSITGHDIAAMVRTGIADHSLPTPAGGSLTDVLYVVNFPRHTTIMDDMLLGTSCATYGGYHNEDTTTDGRPFQYAVIPSCGTWNPFLTDLEDKELAITHEVIEAATDPHWSSAPAFAFSSMTATVSPWLFAGAELADLCEYRGGSAAFARESGHVAALVWSNVASAANDRDPCAPSDPAVPYSGISITPSDVQIVMPGQTLTFDVVGWSTSRVPSLDIAAAGGAATMGAFMADVRIDHTTISNGEHATVTVTIPRSATSGSWGVIYVETSDATGNTDIFPAAVYVP